MGQQRSDKQFYISYCHVGGTSSQTGSIREEGEGGVGQVMVFWPSRDWSQSMAPPLFLEVRGQGHALGSGGVGVTGDRGSHPDRKHHAEALQPGPSGSDFRRAERLILNRRLQ